MNRASGISLGRLFMKRYNRSISSFNTVSVSTTSRSHVKTHKSPEFTLLKLPLQNGQDSDLVFL